MDDVGAPERELRQRVARYPEDRYPVQHATACFHLGTVLTDAGRFEEAQQLLVRAGALFGDALPVEQAKSRNALGAAQRGASRHDAAAESFRLAADVLERHEHRLEAGAARFNLGLVEHERGDAASAMEAFRAARELFDTTSAPAAAASVGRELGALLLQEGRLDDARREAQASLDVSRRLGDHAAVGLASNVLGLVELTDGHPAAAVEAFLTAAAAHPRTVRPEGYALASANAAVAYERLDKQAHARMAARRSLAVGGDAGPVQAQARDVLVRCGDPPGDLARVLEQEPSERWPELMRSELARWAEIEGSARRREAEAWIGSQIRADDPVGHAVALVGGLLELPPAQLQLVVDALLDAWVARDEDEREAFRSQLSRAVVRFHVPQWMRLRSVLEASAHQRGDAGGWG